MANSNPNKGNPAHKRMMNKALKEKRERCWARGEARKKARRMAQEVREVRNAHLREIGRLTPWEEAKEARRAKRGG